MWSAHNGICNSLIFVLYERCINRIIWIKCAHLTVDGQKAGAKMIENDVYSQTDATGTKTTGGFLILQGFLKQSEIYVPWRIAEIRVKLNGKRKGEDSFDMEKIQSPKLCGRIGIVCEWVCLTATLSCQTIMHSILLMYCFMSLIGIFFVFFVFQKLHDFLTK